MTCDLMERCHIAMFGVALRLIETKKRTISHVFQILYDDSMCVFVSVQVTFKVSMFSPFHGFTIQSYAFVNNKDICPIFLMRPLELKKILSLPHQTIKS